MPSLLMVALIERALWVFHSLVLADFPIHFPLPLYCPRGFEPAKKGSHLRREDKCVRLLSMWLAGFQLSKYLNPKFKRLSDTDSDE